jgi:hypothetical protein
MGAAQRAPVEPLGLAAGAACNLASRPSEDGPLRASPDFSDGTAGRTLMLEIRLMFMDVPQARFDDQGNVAA